MWLLFLFLLPFSLLAQAPAAKGGSLNLARDIAQFRQLGDKIREDCPYCLDVDPPVRIAKHLPTARSSAIAIELDSATRENLATTNDLLRDAILLLEVSPAVLDKLSAGLSPGSLARLRAKMLVDLLRAKKQLGGAK